LISPNDQDRIFSGLASEIRMESNTCAGALLLKRFMTSWFMPFSLWDRMAPFEQLRAISPLGDPLWRCRFAGAAGSVQSVAGRPGI
jgi:hypothetical protein